MFDLITKDTSPLRRSLVRAGFFAALTYLPYRAEAEAFFAQAEAGVKDPTIFSGEQTGRITKNLEEMANIARREIYAASVANLVAGHRCALSVQADLEVKVTALLRDLNETQAWEEQNGPLALGAIGRHEWLTGVHGSWRETLACYIGPVMMFLVGLGLWRFAGLSLPGSFLMGASLPWAGLLNHNLRKSLVRWESNRQERSARIAYSLDKVNEILTDSQTALHPLDESTAPVTEDVIGPALRQILDLCSDRGKLLDVHVFIDAAAQLFDHSMEPADRQLVLPVSLLDRLICDGCEPVEAALAGHISAKMGEVWTGLCSFDLVPGDEGLIELSGFRPDEEDLTLFRLPVPSSSGY